MTRWIPRLTLERAWAILPPLLLVAIPLRALIQPHDFWWHLRTGGIIVASGSIPDVDLFSFTRAGEPWTNQAWLMQVALHATYALGGLPTILCLHALLIGGGYMVLGAALARGRTWVAAWGGVLVAFAIGAHHHGVRPQSASFLLFGALVAAMELHRQGHRLPLRMAPLLFVIWVNAHGGFVFGGGALAIHVVGRTLEWARTRDASRIADIRELWVIGIVSFLALAVQPGGPVAMVEYVWGFFESDVTLLSNVEFAPMSARTLEGVLFFAALGGLAIALRTGFRPTLDQGIGLLVFGIASLVVRRIAPWYGLLLAPVLAGAIESRMRARPPLHRPALRPTLYVALAAVFFLVSLPWLRPRLGFEEGRYVPATLLLDEAIDTLCSRAQDGDRVLLAQQFASFHIYHCPQLPVFLDTRIELYPEEMWIDYFALIGARYDWERLAEGYGLDWLVVPPPGTDEVRKRTLVDAARESPEWSEIYGDEVAVVFRRVPAARPDSARADPSEDLE